MTNNGMPIKGFRGDYSFLSNFQACPIEYEGIRYKSAEAAFQAQKTDDPDQKAKFANIGPKDAKYLGRRVSLRPDWESIKLQKMYEIVYRKFAQNPDLAEKLLATDDRYLEETNAWRDTFWGVDARTGYGQNHLGKILMKIRSELRSAKEAES